MSYPINQAITYTAVGATAGNAAATFSYAWTFDDGGTGSVATVNHTWTTTGLHTASVVATDTTTLGTATAMKTVSITSFLWAALGSYATINKMVGPGVYGVQGTKMLVTGSSLKETFIYDFVTNTWSAGPVLNYDARISNSSGANVYRQAPTMPNGEVYLQQIGFGAPQSVNITTGVVTNLAGQGTYSIANYACMGGDGNAYYFCLGGSFNRTYVHNLTTNIWTLKTTLSPAIFGLYPIYIGNNKIFMIERGAGYGYTYDYVADTWTRSANVSGLSVPGSDATSTQILMWDGRVLCVGGTNQKVSIFDPTTNTFTTSTSTDPIVRRCPGLYVTENHSVHIIGGSTVSATSVIYAPLGDSFSASYTTTSASFFQALRHPVSGKPFTFGAASSAAMITNIFDGV